MLAEVAPREVLTMELFSGVPLTDLEGLEAASGEGCVKPTSALSQAFGSTAATQNRH